MYTALIVDDEQWALKGIVNTFRLQDYDIRIICATDNSVEALQVLIEQKPDVVISDILMADITGLDLIKFAKIYGIESEFILVSGYSDFEYAKKAIDFDAFSYVLKPLDKSEIKNKLEKLKAKLDIKKRNKYYFENATLEQNEKVENFFITNNEGYFRCISLNITEHRFLSNIEVPRNILCLKCKDNYFYITEDYFHEVFAQQILNVQLPGTPLKQHIGISNKFQNKEDINIMMSQSNSAQLSYFLYENEFLFYYKEMQMQNIIEISNIIIDYIKDCNFEDLGCFLNKKLLYELRTKKMSIKDFTLIYNRVINYIDEDDDKAITECNIKYYASENEILYDQNICNFISEFYDMIRSIYFSESISTSTDLLHPTLTKILAYIEKNYDQQLGLDLLSEEFSINRTYICDLFKKYTGETLIQYINKIKMLKAKKLINETEYTLKQVAKEVGYDEYPYFVRVFKKHYGISPGKMRKG